MAVSGMNVGNGKRAPKYHKIASMRVFWEFV